MIKLTSLWFESDSWAGSYDENDDNMDVIFTLDNGTKWVASFFTYQNILSLSRKNRTTGECLNGLYFCAADMILIERLNKDDIQKVLEDMIKENVIEVYCTEITDDDEE